MNIYERMALPQDYKAAFKDADIRGVHPTQIDEALTYRVARAFVSEYNYKKVLVARDMRISSPKLHKAFVAGVTDAGADVVDLGLVGTPALYFASGTYNLPGVVITASHNPKEYNGLKLVEPQGIPLTEKFGLGQLRKRVETQTYKKTKRKGAVSKKKILQEYKKYLHTFTDIDTSRNVKIVVDAGNGMGCTLAPILEKGLPIDVIPLFFEMDGTFPNRASNPTLAKNQKPVIAAIKKERPDFGAAFDGDIDRVAFFDEKGKYINSAIIGALIAKYQLTRGIAKKFIYTNFTSKSYYDVIVDNGGKAYRARVGHAFIKRMMRDKDVGFACEHSAHFYFRNNFYTDSGIITLLRVSEIVANGMKEGKTLSQLIKPLDTYFQTEEILVKVPDKKAALLAVEKYFKKKPISKDNFDGLRMEYEDVWFVVKKSVTEDALKFVVESPSKKRALEVQKEILKVLS
ncbi:MAG: phosphomannomutase [Candidatus Azotimanducaceae bacterium]|jgi:phosphomannomutase